MTFMLLLVASIYLFVKLVKEDILCEQRWLRILLLILILLFWMLIVGLLVIFSMAAWANEHTYM